jgi:hypothetical protein
MRGWRGWIGGVAAGVACAVATAPEAPAAQRAGASGSSNDQESARIRSATGDRLARLGLLYIRAVDDPGPSDYRLVSLLLEEARRLSPQNENLVRLLLETAHAAGDREQVLAQTEALLRLEPDNTVAQLRLISARIDRLQRVEDRLAAYDRFLGERGAALDPSVRSRLALDAALLARETGDEAGFIDRLKTAVRLDQTNKQAAVLAADYALLRLEDAVARVELLANVVLADPLDLRAQLNLAQELVAHGAFSLAERFYDNCSTLLRKVGESPREQLGPQLMTLRWGTRGADSVLDEYALTEEAERDMVQRRRRAVEGAGGDPSEVPPWRFEGSLELIRLAAAHAAGREEDVESAYGRMNRLLTAQIEAAAERLEEGEVEDPDSLREATRDRRALLLWLSVSTGRGLEEAERLLDALRDDLEPLARGRFAGWLALREGDLDRAESLLSPIAEEDARARLGLGLVHQERGDTKRAISEFAMVALSQPETSLGLWAQTRIERMLGQRLRPTETVEAIRSSLAALPRDLDEVVRDVSRVLNLTGRHVRSQASPLDRVMVRATLRNVGSFPLAVGEAAPVNSSLLLSPRVSSEGRVLTQGMGPEVVDLARRLRLDPGDSIEAVIWASRGSVGDVLDEIAARPATVRWTLLQGFRQTEPSEEASAVFTTGPFGLSAETDAQERSRVTSPGGTLEDFRLALEQATGERVLELLLYTRERLRVEAQERRFEERRALVTALREERADERSIARFIAAYETGQEELVRVVTDRSPRIAGMVEEFGRWVSPTAEALASVYPTLTEEQRAFALLSAAPGRVNTVMRPLDEAAREDQGRLPKMIYLLTRVESVDEEAMLEALASDHPAMRELARLLSDRFEKMSEAASEAIE